MPLYHIAFLGPSTCWPINSTLTVRINHLIPAATHIQRRAEADLLLQSSQCFVPLSSLRVLSIGSEYAPSLDSLCSTRHHSTSLILVPESCLGWVILPRNYLFRLLASLSAQSVSQFPHINLYIYSSLSLIHRNIPSKEILSSSICVARN